MIIVKATGKKAQIEVRQLFELEDFEPGEPVERFRRIEGTKPSH